MKNKDVAELSEKVKQGFCLKFSHLNSYKNSKGVVQLTANEYDANGSLVSGHLFTDKNIKSVLRVAEEFFKSGEVLKGQFDEPNTNLDYLVYRDFEISIFCSKTEANYFVLKVNYSEQQKAQDLYSTRTLASNGVLAVLLDAERNWAQYVIQGVLGKSEAICYNPVNGWDNF